MIVKVELPNDLAKAISDGWGRERIAREFKMTEMDARYYLRLANESIKKSYFPYSALLLPDIHVPYHDEKALEVALDYGKILDPTQVILTGDFMDFYQASSFMRDPKKRTLKWEIDQGREILKHISETFPNAKKTYLEGNHEYRLQRYIFNKAKELEGLDGLSVPEQLRLDRMGWEYYINSEALQNHENVLKIGKLFILHGHELQIGSGAINLAKIYYDRTKVNVAVSHRHQTQQFMVRKLDQSHEAGWTLGCLCDLSPEYMPVNQWNHGFMIVYYDNRGIFKVRNHSIIQGEVL